MRPVVSSQGRGAAREHAGSRRRASAAGGRIAAVRPSGGRSLLWADSFLYAGTSVLLLSLADLIPGYWYLSFVALIPFLYKVTRASDAEAVRLGFLFGLALFGVRIADSLASSLWSAASVFLLGIGIFAGFGWTVARARYWSIPKLVEV